MFFALSKDGIRTKAIEASKQNEYFCPGCGALLTLKQGNIKEWHFAHKQQCSCDAFTENKMTEWHINHQALFPEECREVRLEKDGIVHIADIKIGDLIIEFQHSPMDNETFEERCWFYSQFGHLVWVFDLTEKWMNEQIEFVMKNHKNDYGYFRWSRSNKMLGMYDFRSCGFDMFVELDSSGYGCLVEWNPDGMRWFSGRRMSHKDFMEYLSNIQKRNYGDEKLQPRKKPRGIIVRNKAVTKDETEQLEMQQNAKLYSKYMGICESVKSCILSMNAQLKAMGAYMPQEKRNEIMYKLNSLNAEYERFSKEIQWIQ